MVEVLLVPVEASVVELEKNLAAKPVAAAVALAVEAPVLAAQGFDCLDPLFFAYA